MPPPPKNVLISSINSTAINVSWDKQSLVELKGLADYVIEYHRVILNRKRQINDQVTVPWSQNHIVISNLTPGARYNVFVSASTSAGMSGIIS